MARTIGHNYREYTGYKDIKKAAADRRILPLDREVTEQLASFVPEDCFFPDSCGCRFCSTNGAEIAEEDS